MQSFWLFGNFFQKLGEILLYFLVTLFANILTFLCQLFAMVTINSFKKLYHWLHDTQYNDNQRNATQHNAIQYYSVQQGNNK
jgi:hypothetical protein